MTHPSSCLELTDVTFKWDNSEEVLLFIKHLRVQQGERVFIQGASGSGKSTLLNILTGVLPCSSGTINILGDNLATKSQSQRDQFRADHFGIIFQQFNLIPYLSVIENVTLPLSFSKYKLKRATTLNDGIIDQAFSILNGLNIDIAMAEQNVTQLSVGQQQRVAAARALMGSPEIIIADEPTSALDANTKNDFLELLFAEAKKFNSSIIFVSHDQSLSPIFDKTLSMQNYKPNTQS